jgi:hypothetical protein
VERPARLTALAAAAGAGASVMTGLRLALDSGRGRMRLPVRSTLAGMALGAGGIAAVLTFGASLDKVLTEPRLHGEPWSAGIPAGSEGEGEDVIDLVTEQLPDLPRVTAATLTDQRSVTIGGEELVVTTLRHLKGSTEVPYLSGRAPAGPDEVAIGPEALARMDAAVGDTVTARGAKGPVRLEVVGSPLVAVEEGFDDIGVLTERGLARMEVSEGARNIYVTTTGPPEEALGSLGDEVELDVPITPAVIANLAEARSIPNALAVFLAVLAVAALVHALLLGLRRRRHDLAVLRVLGLQGRQVTGLVAVQATAISLVGAVIGIPLGVAAGRWVWRQFAEDLHVVAVPVVPVVVVLLVGLSGVVVANLIGLPRSWAARRLSPSAVLRTE